MLTNAAGLETVSVTSATHGWNRTKLGNQWYNVDLTWDDGTPISYQFFNKSDATMEKYDGSSRESHTQNHYYDGVAPGCESDYGASVTVVDAEQIHADTATVVLDLVNNQSGQIRTSFVPANVTDKRLGYVSENTNIATVSASGLVTAVAPGKTSITIRKLTNNQKATCTIEVYGWQDEPETPTVAKYGSTWITLDTQSGCVYSVDGIHWQSSPAFVNLKPNTEYTFYVKRPTSGYYRESKAVSVRVRTLTEEVQAAPAVTVRYRTHVQTYGWQKQVTMAR